MFKLKNKEEVADQDFMVCLVSGCDEEATHLFTTETRIIDVCKKHQEELLSQSFIS